MPLVSVIMPTYNYGRFLSGAIDSVLTQTVRDFELIIVDDGSTDTTPDIVRGITDPRVRYYRQENQGPAAARNMGLSMANGRYIAFLDADDRWLPHKLQSQLAVLERNTSVALVYSHFEYVDLDGRVLRYVGSNARGRVFTELLHSNIIGSPSVVMVRADSLRAIGGFSRFLYGTEDWHAWLRIAVYGNVEVLKQSLVCITDHGASLSKNLRRMARETSKMLAVLQSELGDAIPPHVWRRAWCYRLMGHGHIWALDGNFNRAFHEFKRAVRHDPSCTHAWILLLSTIGGARSYSCVWQVHDWLKQRLH